MWDRLFLDARGMLTRTDTYAPTERMRRFLRPRDRHCQFPGCRMPARPCDIDHNHDHARGGPTDVANGTRYKTHLLRVAGVARGSVVG